MSRRFSRALWPVVGSVAFTLLTSEAAFGACNQTDQDTEASAFRQGLDKFRDGDTKGAMEIWQGLLQTLGNECGWKVLFNLGRAHEKLGDPTRAIESYSAFVAAADKQANPTGKELEVRKAAVESVAALKAKYGAIHVAAPPKGVVWVRVGLSEPQPAGFTLYVAPGSHELELFARTPQSTKQTVHTFAGRVTEIQIPGGATSVAPVRADRVEQEAQPTAEAGPRPFPTVLVVVGGGLTAVSAGASVFLYTRQSAKRADAEAFARSDPSYARLRDEHQDARTLYYVSLGVTGVFAVATTAVALGHVFGGDDAPAHVQVDVRPGTASLGLSGKF